eukprot:2198397-Lingulodinium_polyedra.AAC.1
MGFGQLVGGARRTTLLCPLRLRVRLLLAAEPVLAHRQGQWPWPARLGQGPRLPESGPDGAPPRGGTPLA